MKKREIKQNPQKKKKTTTDKLVYEMTVMQWTERECMVDNIRKKLCFYVGSFICSFVHSIFLLVLLFFCFVFGCSIRANATSSFVCFSQTHTYAYFVGSRSTSSLSKNYYYLFCHIFMFPIVSVGDLRGSKTLIPLHRRNVSFHFVSILDSNVLFVVAV